MEYEFDRDAVSERLREELGKLGLRQSELAEKFGCNRRVISGYFKGVNIPNAYYLSVIHRCGCDIIYILTGERRA